MKQKRLSKLFISIGITACLLIIVGGYKLFTYYEQGLNKQRLYEKELAEYIKEDEYNDKLYRKTLKRIKPIRVTVFNISKEEHDWYSHMGGMILSHVSYRYRFSFIYKNKIYKLYSGDLEDNGFCGYYKSKKPYVKFKYLNHNVVSKYNDLVMRKGFYDMELYCKDCEDW